LFDIEVDRSTSKSRTFSQMMWRRGDLNRHGLKWIRLNDVDSRLKLLLRHGQTIGVLLKTFESGFIIIIILLKII
jgi:hypothetical protein